MNIIKKLFLIIVFFFKFQYAICWPFEANHKSKELEKMCKNQAEEIDQKNEKIKNLKKVIETLESDLSKHAEEDEKNIKEIERLKKAIKTLESDMAKKDLLLSKEKLFFQKEAARKEKDFFEIGEAEYRSFPYDEGDDEDKENDIEWLM